MMHLVGLTGGIGSGKSTVSALLRGAGVPVVDADLVARQVVEPGRPPYAKIVREFGVDILQDGKAGAPIDRERLGAIVFKDAASRKRLNRITHPAVMWAMGMQLARLFLRGEPVAVLDVPLLYETGLHSLMSKVVVVYVDRDTQLRRLAARDKRSDNATAARVDAQMDLEEKRQRADYVIDNRGSRADCERQVDELCKLLHLGDHEAGGGRQARTDRVVRAAVRLLLVGAVLAAVAGLLSWSMARAFRLV